MNGGGRRVRSRQKESIESSKYDRVNMKIKRERKKTERTILVNVKPLVFETPQILNLTVQNGFPCSLTASKYAHKYFDLFFFLGLLLLFYMCVFVHFLRLLLLLLLFLSLFCLFVCLLFLMLQTSDVVAKPLHTHTIHNLPKYYVANNYLSNIRNQEFMCFFS